MTHIFINGAKKKIIAEYANYNCGVTTIKLDDNSLINRQTDSDSVWFDESGKQIDFHF